MPDDGRLADLLKRTARSAGRRYEAIRRSYREGQEATGSAATDSVSTESAGTSSVTTESIGADTGAADDTPDAELSYLPRNENGDARIVCRRYAERRAVGVDDAGRPACFDADHPDCQGCVEDVRDGRVETW
jgi:hypothetical protein